MSGDDDGTKDVRLDETLKTKSRASKPKKASRAVAAVTGSNGRTGTTKIATRDKIVSTSIEFLRERGYEEFGMREIARRAGIAPGNLSYYFPNKYTLLAEVFQEQVRTLSDDVEVALSQTDGGTESTMAAIDVVMKTFYDTNDVFPSWWTIWALAPFDAELRRISDAVYKAFTEALAGAIGKMSPDLDKQGAHRKANLITAMLDGASVQAHMSLGRSRRRQELKQDLRACIVTLLTD